MTFAEINKQSLYNVYRDQGRQVFFFGKIGKKDF